MHFTSRNPALIQVAVDRGASMPYRNNQTMCSKKRNSITMEFYNPKDTVFKIIYGGLSMKILKTGRQHLRPAAALAAGLVLFAFSYASGENDGIAVTGAAGGRRHCHR